MHECIIKDESYAEKFKKWSKIFVMSTISRREKGFRQVNKKGTGLCPSKRQKMQPATHGRNPRPKFMTRGSNDR